MSFWAKTRCDRLGHFWQSDPSIFYEESDDHPEGCGVDTERAVANQASRSNSPRAPSVAAIVAVLESLPIRDNSDRGGELDKLRLREAARAILALTAPDKGGPDEKPQREVFWEDIAHLFCSCGKDHCNAAEHAPDHGLSSDGYAKRYGCGSHETYEVAERVAAWINQREAARSVAETGK